ncbi:unnamed protein product, partial [Mesorhabditis belari]|uniref:Chromo domain-containing protein n=1 Tax=Mesorhabditis belari TaxID=2138241 RepID=A0AAF3ESX4_9BILA
MRSFLKKKPFAARSLSSSESDEEREYEVEKILDDKIGKDGRYYLVKWLGYAKKQSTWENEDRFENAKEILEEYKKCLKGSGRREMEKILDDEMREDGKYYLVKWKRCDDSMNTWRNEQEFKHDRRLVKDYEKRKNRSEPRRKIAQESEAKRRLRQKTVNSSVDYYDCF